MEEPKKTKKKKFGRWILLALFGVLVISLFTGKSSALKLYQSFHDIKEKGNLVKMRHREIDSLKAENARLKTDTAYIEKIAREKLGMAGKSEKVYKFIKDDK
jgi:cell division protein FtsL